MQVSSLYRRGIVLPLNDEAEESLRYDDIDETTRVRHVGIAGQSFFETLWELGLFQGINARAGSLIDDYEEEFVGSDSLVSILESINEVRWKRRAATDDIETFLNDLSALVIDAKNLNRPLLFVL